ncbi:MAG: helix-turn-helix domain-containing protein [Christensenellales bacterium]
MNKFKERLKESRKQEGITQKILAQNIGRTEDCIHDWETGRSEPSLDDILALAHFFSVSTDFLLGNESSDDLFV